MPSQPSIHKLLIDITQACSNWNVPSLGLQDHVPKCGLQQANTHLGNHLISNLAEVGSPKEAEKILNHLRLRAAGSSNLLIHHYVECGKFRHALAAYDQAQENIQLSAPTFVALLKACAHLQDVERGRHIHACFIKGALLYGNPYVGCALVDMYAKCGMLLEAQGVFDKLLIQNKASWNAIMAGYVQHDRFMEALDFFSIMQIHGIIPDCFTYSCYLKACGSMKALDRGEEILAGIETEGLLGNNIIVGNALIDMYVKCGDVVKAQEAFHMLSMPNVISWTTLMSGYVKHEKGEEALHCYEQMRSQGVSPDTISYACILRACGIVGALEMGKRIHWDVEQKGILRTVPFVGEALVDMYVKCGSLVRAHDVFDSLPFKTLVLWTLLISGYAQQEMGEEALDCFEQMQHQGIMPDHVTYASAVKACGIVGASQKGGELHAEMEQKEMMDTCQFVGNALVDMYAKCGLLGKAHNIFNKLLDHDIVSWNALFSGYARHGDLRSISYNFKRMLCNEHINPNRVTFASILIACSHVGLVSESLKCIESMVYYNIIPSHEHYTCMFDIFGRAGQLNVTVALMQEAPIHPSYSMFVSMMTACRKWGNLELGRNAFEHAIQSYAHDCTAYVCMQNIYEDVGVQEAG